MEKYKIYYNENGWVIDRHPFYDEVDESRMIEVDAKAYQLSMITPNHFSWAVQDGKLVNIRREETPTEELKEELRQRRQNECFYYTDRAGWMMSLTEAQLKEIMEWRNKWLDAPKILEAPEKPKWLED